MAINKNNNFYAVFTYNLNNNDQKQINVVYFDNRAARP